MPHEYVYPRNPTTSLTVCLMDFPPSPLLEPRSKHDFKRPSRSMLAVQLQIDFCDVIWIGHVIVDCRAAHSVCAAAVVLPPTNSGVDRHICDVDAVRHQLPRYALRESGLSVTCHGKCTARWESLERSACIGKDDRTFRSVGVHRVFAHETGSLLGDQKRAEGRISYRLERHGWVGFRNSFSKNAGDTTIDVVHEKRRRTKVSNNILKK
jgi:hypothetical protein